MRIKVLTYFILKKKTKTDHKEMCTSKKTFLTSLSKKEKKKKKLLSFLHLLQKGKVEFEISSGPFVFPHRWQFSHSMIYRKTLYCIVLNNLVKTCNKKIPAAYENLPHSYTGQHWLGSLRRRGTSQGPHCTAGVRMKHP